MCAERLVSRSVTPNMECINPRPVGDAFSTLPPAITCPTLFTSMPVIRRSQTRLHRALRSNLASVQTRNRDVAFPSTPLRRDTSVELVKTEPSTPESPTLLTRGYRRRLRRQSSVCFTKAVLHYDQSVRDLKPWYWCVELGTTSLHLITGANVVVCT